MLPCKPIDLTDILEIEYEEEQKPKLSQIRDNLEKDYPHAFNK